MTALQLVNSALAHLRKSEAYRAMTPAGRRNSHLGYCERDLLAAIKLLSPPPPPPATLGIFESNWAFVRDHASGYEQEKMAELRAAGYKVLALNVADHAADDWHVWRSNAGSLMVIPWARTSTLAQLTSLRRIAESWYSPGLIANLEQEATEPRWLMTGAQVAAALGDFMGTVGISTEPHLPENFEWQYLINEGFVCLPQSCVNESAAFTPAYVTARARQLGWTLLSPSFATYTTATMDPLRSNYVGTAPFGIFTLDDLRVDEIASWV